MGVPVSRQGCSLALKKVTTPTLRLGQGRHGGMKFNYTAGRRAASHRFNLPGPKIRYMQNGTHSLH